MRLIYSSRYEIDIGPHVFPTKKYRLIKEKLIEEGIAKESDFFEPEPESFEELKIVHTEEYLDDLKNLRWTRRTMFSELPLNKEVVDFYLIGARGTYLAALDALEKGLGIHIGGGWHHAFADKAEGFCYINDLAYAVKRLKKENKIKGALVIDLDVHQGNGTAKIFENDEDVFTFSIHQEDLYPVPKQRSDLDIGLWSGTGEKEYLEVLEESLSKIFEGRTFDLVLYQAGADPYEKDLLGNLRLTKEGLKKRDEIVRRYTLERGFKVVITLGGGYSSDIRDLIEIHSNTIKVFLLWKRERQSRM
ncbi:MAG: histone deacetylase [Candidatus Hydrothermales bacterium]